MLKKRSANRYVLFFLLVMFIITGCAPNKSKEVVPQLHTPHSPLEDSSSKDGNIIEDSDKFLITYISSNNIKDVQAYMGPKIYLGDSYVNFDKIFYMDGKYDNNKYSPVTKDGKINWASTEDKVYNRSFTSKNIEQLFTLDNKKIVFPMKFADICDEYKIFDEIDWSKIASLKNKKKYNLIKIVDKKSGNMLYSIELANGEPGLYSIVNKDNEYVVSVDMDKNNIIGISNTFQIGRYDLKVDGIGIGSTLNEMYEKLGVPNEIHKNKDNSKEKIYYQFEDTKSKKLYGVYFVSKLNSKNTYVAMKNKELDLFPYIITHVLIYSV